MSTRSQVLIKSKSLPKDVYLYKHHDGYDTPKYVAKVLKDLNGDFEPFNLCNKVLSGLIIHSGYSVQDCVDIDFYHIDCRDEDQSSILGGRFEVCDSIHGDIQVLVVIDLNEMLIRVITDYTGDGKHVWEFITFQGFIELMDTIDDMEEVNFKNEIF